MRIASRALAIERQASAQSALAERVSKPKTRAILGFMRLNFLSVIRHTWLHAIEFPIRHTWLHAIEFPIRLLVIQ